MTPEQIQKMAEGFPPSSIGKDHEEVVTWLAGKHIALQEQVQKLAAESNKWKPDFCPVTRRPFFMWIEHPTVGMVPTYGGPYDSYTIPEVDNDGEFSCERFDHDEGGWVDGVCLGVRLIDDQQQVVDDAVIREIGAKAVEGFSASLNGATELWHPCDVAEEYASQLRAGEHP